MTKKNNGLDESLEVLRTSKSTKEKKAAVKKINTIGMNAEIALDELMKIVKGRHDFSLQGLAEEAVIKIGEPAIPALKKFLYSPFRKKRSKGIGMLGEIACNDSALIDKIVPLLRPIALYDLRFEVRLDAVVVLKKIIQKNKKSQSTIELLGKVLRKDGMPNVRIVVGDALANADHKLAMKELMYSIDRKNYFFLRPHGGTRISAANALWSLGSNNYAKIKDAVPLLLETLENDRSPAMRITVLLPLVLSGGWDVIEDVLDLIVKDRWHQVRTTALTTIGTFIGMKPVKKNVRSIIPIVKKIAREDKFEYVQNYARELLIDINVILKEEQ